MLYRQSVQQAGIVVLVHVNAGHAHHERGVVGHV